MSRVKRGVTNHARHKKVLKAAEGYYGRRKSTIRIAKQAVEKAGQYAYRDHGLTYGRFIDGLSKAEVAVDRKVLSDLAITQPEAFGVLVAKAKAALAYLEGVEKTTHERVSA